MGDASNPFMEAYEQARRALRAGDASNAERQLRALLAASPGEVNSLRLLGVALLAQQKTAAAIEALEQSKAAAPDFLPTRTDLARAYRQAGRLDAAYIELQSVLKEAPTFGLAWLALGDVLVDRQEFKEAAAAFRRSQHHDPRAQALSKAREALKRGDHEGAESLFKAILKIDAGHVGALCGLAAALTAQGQPLGAERLLRHALQQTAHLPLVWGVLGQALLETPRLLESRAAMQRAITVNPDNPQYWVGLGAVGARLMQPEAALAAYQEAERLDKHLKRVHLSIGHVLKTLGRRAECERIYRECLALEPSSGEVFWSLADLKDYRFSEHEIAAMQSALSAQSSGDENLALLHFALGHAREQRGDIADSFRHYTAGNRLRARSSPFDFAGFRAKCLRIAAALDGAFIGAAEGAGAPQPDAIFIVGLPRSGSTLVEQILASHPSVDGTMELPNIPNIVREFERLNAERDAYPESLRAAPRAVLAALGRRYLEETLPLRTGRARFIDKLPNNFSHIGLIHAILPNAAIIDVRRHPMDACFSCFKQNFAAGQSFTYDLEGLGFYYRSYLELMDHWDAVLPGKVLHISYEALVASPEAEIRRLLDHCRLEFDPRCLKFHETDRPIGTASSEQVRQPLYTSGVGYWRRYAPALEPLRLSLGDCLDRFDAAG